MQFTGENAPCSGWLAELIKPNPFAATGRNAEVIGGIEVVLSLKSTVMGISPSNAMLTAKPLIYSPPSSWCYSGSVGGVRVLNIRMHVEASFRYQTYVFDSGSGSRSNPQCLQPCVSQDNPSHPGVKAVASVKSISRAVDDTDIWVYTGGNATFPKEKKMIISLLLCEKLRKGTDFAKFVALDMYFAISDATH